MYDKSTRKLHFGALTALLFGLLHAALVQAKPNIVLILADDVSADMFSCYGQPGAAKTPNIDRIAAEGVQFETCFAPAICGPSRACMMTGVYGNRTGVFRNDMWAFDSRGTLFTQQHSWAKLMQQGGYKTAIAGKWHCGAKEPWEEGIGFDEYCMYESPEKIKSHFGIDVIANGRRKDITLPDVRYWYSSMVQNGDYVDVTEQDFGPDQRRDFLMDFMERKARANQAFVAYWPIVIPHGPYSTTPDFGEPMDIERTKPNVQGLSKEEKERVMAEHDARQALRFKHLIQYMDKLIGQLIAKAEDLGIYENTYIIFCSDNGTATTAKDRGVERGVQVPYVVRGPGIKKRGLVNALTDFSDIAPTLLDMGGITHPTDVPFDGKSQLPFLIGKSKTHREWIYAYTGAVQVFRTRTHLLEARAPAFDKPDGRLYYTGDRRFGDNYTRVDTHPEHSHAQKQFKKIIASIPSHLEEDHSFWASKFGQRWKKANPDPSVLAEKQLYNHKEYQRYDETD